MREVEIGSCLDHSDHEAIKNLCQQEECQQNFISGLEESRLQTAQGISE